VNEQGGALKKALPAHMSQVDGLTHEVQDARIVIGIAERGNDRIAIVVVYVLIPDKVEM